MPKDPANATAAGRVGENTAQPLDYGALFRHSGPPHGSKPEMTTNEMPATPDDLFACLDRLGIAHSTISHPPLFTVEESVALRGSIPGGHNKNLFLKDRNGRLFLLVLLEDAKVDLKALPKLLECGRLSFGSAELMRETLGVEPGSVTPFALINDPARRITPVLDEAMLAHDLLNYHPLVNTMTTTIRRDDLLKFVAAMGHSPLIRAVSARPAI